MAWNGFPTRVKNAVINRLFKKHTQTPHNNNNQKLEDIRPKIWICLPYLGNHGENLIRTLLKKIQRCLKQPINFIVIYDTKKISYFVSNKTVFLIFLEATLCTNSLVRAVIQNISAKLIDVFLHDSLNMANLTLILITTRRLQRRSLRLPTRSKSAQTGHLCTTVQAGADPGIFVCRSKFPGLKVGRRS